MLKDDFTVGFDGIGRKLSDLIAKIEKKEDAIELVAKDFVDDIRRLPKPRRRISAPEYTHLIDSVSYRKKNGLIQIGWGKYYGPMVEHGSIHANAQPHLTPTWQQNKDKYIEKLKSKFGL